MLLTIAIAIALTVLLLVAGAVTTEVDT